MTTCRRLRFFLDKQTFSTSVGISEKCENPTITDKLAAGIVSHLHDLTGFVLASLSARSTDIIRPGSCSLQPVCCNSSDWVPGRSSNDHLRNPCRFEAAFTSP